MPTNWEKHFGTPERASKTRVQEYGGFGTQARIAVEHKGREIIDLPKRSYKRWLEREADHA